jgi:UDP-glucose 4-epimerase
MKTLILGGNGFIGSHLVDKCISEGHSVRVFDKYEEHYRKPLTGVDYRFGDFGNRGLVAEALIDIDIVFHLVSTTLPKTSNDDPAFDVQSNVIETLFLIEQCVHKKIKKVIFVSSGGTIYGTPHKLPINEASPTEPECSYGITKLTIEKYLALFHKLYGIDYAIVRPSNPYGARQNPNGIQGAIAVFLGKVTKGDTIEIWGDGTIIRDYIFIDDFIEGLYRAAIMNTQSRIFNIGSGIGHSLNNIILILRDKLNRDFNVNYTGKRVFDVPAIYLDITRAKKELGWSPVVPLDAGIEQTWNFIKELK